MSDDEVPLAIGEVHGYRFWNLSPTGHLVSVTHAEYTWQHGINEAACAQISDEPRAPVVPEPPRAEDFTTPKPAPWPANHPPARAFQLGEPEPHHPRRVPQPRGGSAVISEESLRSFVEAGAAQWKLEQAQERYRRDLESYPAQLAQYQVALAAHRAYEAAHIAPMEDCDCGFYVVSNPNTASGYAGPTSLLGVVQGFGRMVPMEKGWRLGKARIVALCPWWDASPETLAHKYRYEYYNDPKDYMQSFMQQPRRVRLVRNEDAPEVDPRDRARENYPDAQWFADPATLRAHFDSRIGAS